MQSNNTFLLTALVSLQRHLGISANDGTDPTMDLVSLVLQDQLNMFREMRAEPTAADPAWREQMIAALETILPYVSQNGAQITGASCDEPQSLP